MIQHTAPSCNCHDDTPVLNTGEEHNHDHSKRTQTFRFFLPATMSFLVLSLGIVMDNWWPQAWFFGPVRLLWYIAAYIPVGVPVLKDASKSIIKGDVFSEFLLMAIATIGAFSIGEYPEGVAVMLFYSVGEVFQGMAVRRAKANIKSLLDQRPDVVTIVVNNEYSTIKATQAQIDQVIRLKPGEQLALDGVLVSDTASFNTAALTGESKPDTKTKGETVLAGMINLSSVSLVRITTAYTDSKLSKILELVQNATAQKAPAELFIRKFARIYTPIVVLMAVLICVLPMLFTEHYNFEQWLYRALVFLVISCPCALVISIPLGYFGGIGAASKHGILFKGSNFLDLMANIDHVVMDKTGTLTEGVFEVQEVVFAPGTDTNRILQLVNALEQNSTHPIATAIHKYTGSYAKDIILTDITEIPGQGLSALHEGKPLLAGNFKLLDQYGISYNTNPSDIVYTTIAVAYEGNYIGYLTIADKIKEDAAKAIQQLHQLGVQTTMLSGDKHNVVQYVAGKLNIANAYGNLLPEDKVTKVKALKTPQQRIAFVGDGVNDAPVVALSDVGIAMGGLGSDATIETADVVIQNDQPSKIPMAVRIGKATRKIVWQNIGLAFGVKAIVLILGAGGLATMWEAVFADVGVALLAIVNAIRIQRKQF